MNLVDKNIVITGASGGIGSAIAKALDAEGCQLLLAARNDTKLQALLAELSGQNHKIIAVDLSTAEGRKSLLDAVQDQQVDSLINALGVNQLSLLNGMSEAEINHLVTVNLTVPMQLSSSFIPLLKTRSESAIMNIGSILGSIGYAGSTVYCASKFGLRGFTESLRRELADTAIEVVYFAPRATNTEMNNDSIEAMNKDLGTAVDEPDVVAKAAVAALKNSVSGNRYLGWPEAFFVRLNSILPGLVDKALFKQLPTIQRYATSSNNK